MAVLVRLQIIRSSLLVNLWRMVVNLLKIVWRSILSQVSCLTQIFFRRVTNFFFFILTQLFFFFILKVFRHWCQKRVTFHHYLLFLTLKLLLCLVKLLVFYLGLESILRLILAYLLTFLAVVLLQLLFNNVHLKATFEFVQSILHVTSTID